MSTPDGGLRRSAAPDDRATGARRGVGTAAASAGALGVLLATASAAVVVLSDDARWLRLGAVAALWAALIAVLLLARRAAVTAADADAEADRWRRARADELDEAAARREYEENLERDLRAELAQEMQERHRGEVAELRAEIERLAARPEPHPPVPVVAPVAAGPAPAAAAPVPVAPGPAAPVPAAPVPAAPVPAAGPSSSPVAAPVTAPAAAVTAPSPLAAAYRAARAGRDLRLRHPGPPAGPARPRTPPGGLPSDPVARGPFADPAARPSVLGRESFVDGYLRSAGYDVTAAEMSDPPGAVEAPRERRVHPMRTVRSAHDPPARDPRDDGEPPASSTTTGRTVAELLAAHSAALGHDPRRGRRPAS